MTSKSGIGKGSILSIGNGGTGETFTKVAEVKSIKPSGYKMGTYDSTNLDSTNSEVGSTIIDYGEYDVEGNFLPLDPGQGALATAFAAGGSHDFTLQLPKLGGQTTSGNLIAFTGVITEYTPFGEIAETKGVDFSAKIKINVPPTVTPGS
jgi:hypothetical protein